MIELLPKTSAKSMYGWAAFALFLHAVVLFGWSKVVMEESAYGMGNVPGPQGTFEMVALPPPEPPQPQPQVQVEEPVPPKVVESEFKKKAKVAPKVKAVPQPPAAPVANPNQVASAQPSGDSPRIGSSGSGGTSAEPDYLRNPAPTYPRASRLAREQGVVMLLVKISREGRVLGMSLKESSGFSRLDESALAAVEKWKFKPAMLAGIVIESNVEVPIRFALK